MSCQLKRTSDSWGVILKSAGLTTRAGSQRYRLVAAAYDRANTSEHIVIDDGLSGGAGRQYP